MTVATAEHRAAETARARTGVDRLLAALPLTLAFLTAVTIYAYQAWAHHTPWLFSDEIEYTDLSRAIAATGHPAIRGEPHSFESLYTYLIAPVWWLHSTATAYAAAKYIGVVVMSASVFPAYALARMLVRQPAALLAATLTGAAPALGYSSFLVAEPLAYTWATVCFFLLVKALATRRSAWVAAAAAALVIAPFVRGELKMLLPAAVLTGIWMLWTTARAESFRARWTPLHWIGFVVLVAAAAYGLSELTAAVSHYWDVAVHQLGDRTVRYGNWAAGSLTIGLGVLPVVLGLTTLVRPPEPRTPAFRAFVGLFGASIAIFMLYTAVKAAYLSTVFAIRIEERNLIYLTPLVAVAFAVFLERPRVRIWALAGAGAIVGYLVYTTPYQLTIRPYSDAPGLSILAWASERYRWADEDVRKALLGALAFSLLFGLAAVYGSRYRRVLVPVLAAAAVGTVVWNLNGEISFANASNGEARFFERYLPQPLDWIDRATNGQKSAYIGGAMSEGNSTWSFEFWNRRLVKIGSLDGTAPGPGPTLTPVPYSADGRVVNDPQTPYVLAGTGVDPQGKPVTTRNQRTLRLYRVDGPLRLRSVETGMFADGWTGKRATYSRFVEGKRRPGRLTISASRAGWKGNSLAAVVTIKIGRLKTRPVATIANPCHGKVCVDTAPYMGRVLATRQVTVGSGETKTVKVRVTPPFQVELDVYPTFSPSDFGVYDSRQLGIQPGFTFVPDRG